MPTPDFIVELREKIGHDLLWLPSVTAVVLDDSERVLLVRRADNHKWTLVTGCLEPGEQPATGAVREVFEETGVQAVVERLIGVQATEPNVCANGDQVQWLDVSLACRAVGGERGSMTTNPLTSVGSNHRRCRNRWVRGRRGNWPGHSTPANARIFSIKRLRQWISGHGPLSSPC